jgi:hypothetical protein
VRLLSDIVANAIGGLVAAMVVYFVIEHRLRLNRERRHRAEVSRDILEALREELEHNREIAREMRTHLPEGALPYDAFELGGWTLVSQVPVVTTLEPQTVQTLFEAYRRLRGANEQHDLLLDLMYGPTGTLSAVLATTSITGESRDGLERLEKRRSGLRNRLIKRVETLEPYLDSALDEIRRELAVA